MLIKQYLARLTGRAAPPGISTRWLDSLLRPMFILWLLSMIALPILRAVFGEAGTRWGVILSVVMQAGAVLSILAPAWGVWQTVRLGGGVAVLTWAIEAIGSATGVPFGAYSYTDKLQPQLGHVPLLIPLAWLMMLPAAWAMAGAVLGTHRGWAFVGVSALAFTAWDLFLDPQMVAWGLWVWHEPGGYFGIPWVNYLGWMLSAALITALLRPPPVPPEPLIAIYIIVWLLETGGLIFFWGMPGPGLVGFAGMGAFVLWWQLARRRATATA